MKRLLTKMVHIFNHFSKNIFQQTYKIILVKSLKNIHALLKNNPCIENMLIYINMYNNTVFYPVKVIQLFVSNLIIKAIPVLIPSCAYTKCISYLLSEQPRAFDTFII